MSLGADSCGHPFMKILSPIAGQIWQATPKLQRLICSGCLAGHSQNQVTNVYPLRTPVSPEELRSNLVLQLVVLLPFAIQ